MTDVAKLEVCRWLLFWGRVLVLTESHPLSGWSGNERVCYFIFTFLSVAQVQECWVSWVSHALCALLVLGCSLVCNLLSNSTFHCSIWWGNGNGRLSFNTKEKSILCLCQRGIKAGDIPRPLCMASLVDKNLAIEFDFRKPICIGLIMSTAKLKIVPRYQWYEDVF